jgi:hypothetical protein
VGKGDKAKKDKKDKKAAKAGKASKTGEPIKAAAAAEEGPGPIVVPNVEAVRKAVDGFIKEVIKLDNKHGPMRKLTTLRLRSQDLLTALGDCQGGMTLP